MTSAIFTSKIAKHDAHRLRHIFIPGLLEPRSLNAACEKARRHDEVEPARS